MNRTERILQEIEAPTTPPLIRDQLTEAFENYKFMASELEKCKTVIFDLRVENGSLAAEVAMLRDQLERSETDRVRLQAIASTFVGGIRSLNAVAASLYELAIKNGLDAAEAARPEEEKRDAEEAREILERVEPADDTVATLPPNQM